MQVLRLQLGFREFKVLSRLVMLFFWFGGWLEFKGLSFQGRMSKGACRRE